MGDDKGREIENSHEFTNKGEYTSDARRQTSAEKGKENNNELHYEWGIIFILISQICSKLHEEKEGRHRGLPLRCHPEFISGSGMRC